MSDCRVLLAHSRTTPVDHGLSMAVYRDGRVEFRRAVQPNTVCGLMHTMHPAQAMRLAALYDSLPARVIISRPTLHVHFTGAGNQLGKRHDELLTLTEELLEVGARMLYSCNAVARDYARVHKFQ